MFLIFYMFAVFGIMMFAKEDEWHFGGYERTFYTLWRLSTFDGWTDILYLHYYGDPEAEPPVTAKPIIAYIYFHLFAVLSALIILSMFIGAMAIAMIGVLDDMARERKSKHQEVVRDQKKAMFRRFSLHSKAMAQAHADMGGDEEEKEKKGKKLGPKARAAAAAAAGGGGGGGEEDGTLSLAERRKVHKIQKSLALALGDKYETKFTQKECRELSSKFGQCYGTFALRVRRVANSNIFSNFIAAVIVFAGVMVGLQTDGIVQENLLIEGEVMRIHAKYHTNTALYTPYALPPY
jgi:hypothetical protein